MEMIRVRDRLARWLEDRWYREGRAIPWLVPAAVVFSAAARLRRRAYLNGWRTIERLPVPVIVVGNLTVGGTGKTPLTVWLVEFFRGAGFRPGVVSRGYGGDRDPGPPMPVTPDSDPAIVGDEPVLIAQRTGAPVMVAANRVNASRAMLDAGACDLVLADDGLQHYRLARDLEILLIDGDRRLGNGRCLPAGPLREPADRVESVDFIVHRGSTCEPGGYWMTVTGPDAVNLISGERRPLARFAGERVGAVAGIAHPERFFRDLQSAGLSIDGRAFPDHHRFSRDDIAFDPGNEVLMTEKDAVKCRRFATPHHWYVPVQAQLSPEFGPDLLQRLRVKLHGQATPRDSGLPDLQG